MQGCADFWVWLAGVSWLEWARTVFDLLKGVAWPAAIFLIVWVFRDQIRQQIPRLKEAGPTGFSFHDGSQPTTSPGSGQLLTGPHPLETVNVLAAQISEELLAFVPEQREPRLIRALAEARTLSEFEFIFANIFKSQVAALERLTEGSVSLETANDYFLNEVAPLNELFPTWGFEKWSGYLTAQNLALIEDGAITITPKGRDFLEFVHRHKAGFMLSN